MLRFKNITFNLLLIVLTNLFVGHIVAQPAQNSADSFVYTSDSANQLLALASIPANSVYQGKWDNNYIKVYKNLLPGKPECSLILFCGTENTFTVPFTNGKIMSQFGFRGRRVHSGLDIRQKTGDQIVSAFDGKVRLAKYSRGYGNVIVVRHFNGLETVYAHLSKIKVKVNQDVKSGEVIGLAGATGRATASHLHFETRFLGEAFDPQKIIDFDNNKLRQDTFEIKPETFVINQRAHIDSSRPDSAISSTSNANHSVKTSKQFHTIKKGDTLYSLARNNGTTVQAVCKLNHFTPKTKLKVGRVIRLK